MHALYFYTLNYILSPSSNGIVQIVRSRDSKMIVIGYRNANDNTHHALFTHAGNHNMKL